MAQYNVWEKEYQKSQLVTKDDKPQSDALRFFKYLRKEEKLKLENLNILDLGCGTGRNSNYLAEMGNNVTGIDISTTALKIATKRTKHKELAVSYLNQSIGARLPFGDNSFDLVIDVTSSNSLNKEERKVYLKEVARVLKSDGFFFVRTLCKDGDKNAKKLLKQSPGKDYDTYIIKDLGLTERIFSEQDFRDMYSRFFKIKELIKKTGYAKFKGQSYKRNYWMAYMQK